MDVLKLKYVFRLECGVDWFCKPREKSRHQMEGICLFVRCMIGVNVPEMSLQQNLVWINLILKKTAFLTQLLSDCPLCAEKERHRHNL